jgi:hypothetical protein
MDFTALYPRILYPSQLYIYPFTYPVSQNIGLPSFEVLEPKCRFFFVLNAMYSDHTTLLLLHRKITRQRGPKIWRSDNAFDLFGRCSFRIEANAAIVRQIRTVKVSLALPTFEIIVRSADEGDVFSFVDHLVTFQEESRGRFS